MAEPTYDSLDKMFGGGPLALHFQMNQMDQAKQVAAEEFKKKQQDTLYRAAEVKKQGLANLFDEQNNPLKLDEQRTTNRTKEHENTIKGNEAAYSTATQQYKINDAARAELTKLNDHQLKLVEQEARKMMMTGTPEQQAQGAQVMQMTTEFYKDKLGKDADMARERFSQGEQTKRNAATNATTIKSKQMDIDAGKYRDKTLSQTAVFFNKLQAAAPKTRVGILEGILTTGVDPSTKEPITPVERAYYQAMYDQDIRTIDATPSPVKDDAVLKMDPVTGKPVLGAPTPRPSAGKPGNASNTGPTVEQMRAALRNNLK